MDCQYTSNKQWSSICTAITTVESSGDLYGLSVHRREQWSSIWTVSTPVESSGVLYGLPVHQQRVVEFYTDCQYISREQWSSIRTIVTASTPVETSGVLYGLSLRPVESSGDLYGLPVHQQRVVESYMNCQYTSREQWSSIWTASTPVERS